MTPHRFLSSVLVLSALALAPRLAHADAAPPNSCTGEGTACSTAGTGFNQPGICTMTKCTKGTPDGSMQYDCLLCLESDSGAAGSGGSAGSASGGAAGSSTGGSAGSGTGGSAGSGTGGSAGASTGGSAGSGTGGASTGGNAGGSTGGSSGASSSSSGDSGGCSLTALPEGGGLAGLMMLAGAAALAIGRKRR